MRVALLYFGKARSIRRTYPTQKEYVFDKLTEAGIEFDTYMHTWETSDNFVWDKNTGYPEDEESYALLGFKQFRKDVQEEFLGSIDFHKYFYPHVWATRGHSNEGEWLPGLIRNHICALESQRRVFEIAQNSGVHYDAFVVIRPDAYFTSPLDTSVFQHLNDSTLVVPGWFSFEGYNDRMAIGTFTPIRFYTHRLSDLPEFREKYGRIVAEKCLKLAVQKYGLTVVTIDTLFKLCRPDGTLI
jgi:hypothetical protein